VVIVCLTVVVIYMIMIVGESYIGKYVVTCTLSSLKGKHS